MNVGERERTTSFSVFRVLRIFSYIFLIHFLTLALWFAAVRRPPSTLEMACVWSNIYNAIYVINSIFQFWIVTLHCRTLSPHHFKSCPFAFLFLVIFLQLFSNDFENSPECGRRTTSPCGRKSINYPYTFHFSQRPTSLERRERVEKKTSHQRRSENFPTFFFSDARRTHTKWVKTHPSSRPQRAINLSQRRAASAVRPKKLLFHSPFLASRSNRLHRSAIQFNQPLGLL